MKNLHEPNSGWEKGAASLAMQGFRAGLEVARELHHEDKEVFGELINLAKRDTVPMFFDGKNITMMIKSDPLKPIPKEN